MIQIQSSQRESKVHVTTPFPSILAGGSGVIPAVVSGNLMESPLITAGMTLMRDSITYKSRRTLNQPSGILLAQAGGGAPSAVAPEPSFYIPSELKGKVRKCFLKGVEFLNAQKLIEAELEIKKALNLEPNSYYLKNWLFYIYSRQNRKKDKEIIKLLLTIDESNCTDYDYRILMFTKKCFIGRKCDGALDMMNDILKEEPNHFICLCFFIGNYLSQKNWALAEIYLKKAINLNEKDESLHFALLSIYQNTNDTKNLIDAYDRVLKMFGDEYTFASEKDGIVIHWTYAMQILLKQNFAVALREAKKAEKQINSGTAPQDVFTTYTIIGMSLMPMGHEKEALKYLLMAADIYEKEKHDKQSIVFLNPVISSTIFVLIALTYCSLNQIEQSLEAIDKAIVLNPNDPEPYANKGLILKLSGKYLEAITEYEKALAVPPNDPYFKSETMLNLAECHVNHSLTLKDTSEQNKFLTRAKQLLEEAMKNAKNDAYTYYKIARLHVKLNDDDKAEGMIKRSLDLGGHGALSYALYGNICYRKGKNEDAVAMFEKAVALDSKDTYSWGMLGIINFDLRNYKKALDAYTEVLKLQPHESLFLLGAGEAQFMLGNEDKAEEYFILAEKYETEPNEVYQKVAIFLLSQFAEDKFERSMAYAKRTIHSRPDDPLPHALLGAILQNSDRSSEGMKYYEKAIQLGIVNIKGPLVSETYCGLIECLLEVLETGKADHYLSEMNKIKNKDVYFYLQSAEAYRSLADYMGKGYLVKALNNLNEALELDPQNSVVLTAKAFVLIQMGKAKDAMEIIGKVEDAYPGDFGIWIIFVKATALYELGRYQEALNEYYRLKTVLPNMVLVRKNIADCLFQLKRDSEANGEIKNALNEFFSSKNSDLGLLHSTYAEYLDPDNNEDLIIEGYETALKLSPQYPYIYISYARFLGYKKYYFRAEDILKKVLNFAPDNEEAKSALELVKLIIVENDEGKAEDLQYELEQLKIEPLTVSLGKKFSINPIFLDEKRAGTEYKAEIIKLRNRISEDPKDIFLYAQLGQIYIELEMYAQAMEVFDEGLKIDGSNRQLISLRRSADLKLKQTMQEMLKNLPTPMGGR